MGILNPSTPLLFRRAHSLRRKVNVGAKGHIGINLDSTIAKGSANISSKSIKPGEERTKVQKETRLPQKISNLNLKYYTNADEQLVIKFKRDQSRDLNVDSRGASSTTTATKRLIPSSYSRSDSLNDGKNYYNYYQPLLTDIMPKLASESAAIPSIASLIDEPTTPEPPPPANVDITGEGWSTVGSKKKRNSSPVINPYAKTMAPFTIPRGSNEQRYEDVDTKLRMLTSIRINPPRTEYVQYNLSRILAAILQGIQGVTPKASLGPVHPSDNDLPRINNMYQIPEDPEIILKYIEDSGATRANGFTAKIVINCDYEIHELKRDAKFRQWLTDERLNIEYNPLRAKVPMNVGFLYKINPRDDTRNLHCSRLQKLLPPNSPPFHLVKQPLYIGKSKTVVLVIKADEPDIPILDKLFDAINKKRADIEYYPWDVYLDLSRSQKVQINQDQNKFTTKFRTYLIPGFIDEDDDIPLICIEENDTTMVEDRIVSPYETMGVTQFLRTIPTSAKGTLLFAYVFPPTNGIREVWVKHEHSSEAMSYIKSVYGELAREMNPEAIELIFSNPKAAIEAAALDKWQPFKRLLEIPKSPTTITDNTNRNISKRYRTNESAQAKNYASITRGPPRQQHVPSPVATIVTTDTMIDSVSNDLTTTTKIAALEQTNENLMRKVENMERTICDHMSKATNNSGFRDDIKAQIETQAAETEIRLSKMVEDKISQVVDSKFAQFDEGMDEKLNQIVGFVNENTKREELRVQRDEERIRREEERVRLEHIEAAAFKVEDRAFKAMMSTFVANQCKREPLSNADSSKLNDAHCQFQSCRGSKRRRRRASRQFRYIHECPNHRNIILATTHSTKCGTKWRTQQSHFYRYRQQLGYVHIGKYLIPSTRSLSSDDDTSTTAGPTNSSILPHINAFNIDRETTIRSPTSTITTNHEDYYSSELPRARTDNNISGLGQHQQRTPTRHRGTPLPTDITTEDDEESYNETDNHSRTMLYESPTQTTPTCNIPSCSNRRPLRDIDNRWEGNLMGPKLPNTTRIVFQNINSLQPRHDIKWIQTIQSALHHEIDMLGLAETSVNWKLRKLKQHHRRTLNNEARQSTHNVTSTAITFSKNRTESSSAYLPGGTASITLGKWTGTLQEHLHDSGQMGRWSGQGFRINEEVSLFVITGYRVCKQPPNQTATNNTSSFTQQRTILRNNGVTSPEPRQQFINDLIQHFQIWNISDRDHVIVMLDANEAMGTSRTGMVKLMEMTNLRDVFRDKHPDPNLDFPCHVNGSQRIDYILARPHTCVIIKSVGYAPFYSLFDSDQRAVYCDLDTGITQQQLVPLVSPPIRLIGTNSSKTESAAYIRKLYEQFQFHRVREKALQLSQTADISLDNDAEFCKELYQLDELITHLMLKTENDTCTKKHPAMWSPPILHSCLMVQYWTIKMKEARRNMDVSEQLSAILAKLPETHAKMIENNTTSTKTALADEKANQRILLQQHHELRSEYLKGMIEKAKADADDSETKALLQMHRREETRRNFAELRTIFHPNRSNGISHLEVHNAETGSVVKITDPTVIEATLIKRNI